MVMVDHDMGWKVLELFEEAADGKTKMMRTMNEDRADYSLFCDLQRLTWLKQKAFFGEY